LTNATAAASPPPTSSSKSGLDFKAKTEIQALVKLALKPHYTNNEITSDEYTDINRDVSRRLYEQVGSEKSLAEKEKWQKVADDEVSRAIQTLKAELPSKPATVVEQQQQQQIPAASASA